MSLQIVAHPCSQSPLKPDDPQNHRKICFPPYHVELGLSPPGPDDLDAPFPFTTVIRGSHIGVFTSECVASVALIYWPLIVPQGMRAALQCRLRDDHYPLQVLARRAILLGASLHPKSTRCPFGEDGAVVGGRVPRGGGEPLPGFFRLGHVVRRVSRVGGHSRSRSLHYEGGPDILGRQAQRNHPRMLVRGSLFLFRPYLTASHVGRI
jgi:hypothetical protein